MLIKVNSHPCQGLRKLSKAQLRKPFGERTQTHGLTNTRLYNARRHSLRSSPGSKASNMTDRARMITLPRPRSHSSEQAGRTIDLGAKGAWAKYPALHNHRLETRTIFHLWLAVPERWIEDQAYYRTLSSAAAPPVRSRIWVKAGMAYRAQAKPNKSGLWLPLLVIEICQTIQGVSHLDPLTPRAIETCSWNDADRSVQAELLSMIET